MRGWLLLKSEPQVTSFGIQSPTDGIAVYIHPNDGKIPKSNSKLGRKFNDGDLKRPMNSLPVVHPRGPHGFLSLQLLIP